MNSTKESGLCNSLSLAFQRLSLRWASVSRVSDGIGHADLLILFLKLQQLVVDISPPLFHDFDKKSFFANKI
jgi:hypothetical protein